MAPIESEGRVLFIGQYRMILVKILLKNFIVASLYRTISAWLASVYIKE